ncbi:MAG: phosphatase PAP2 family protein [Blastocatellia bacterium]
MLKKQTGEVRLPGGVADSVWQRVFAYLFAYLDAREAGLVRIMVSQCGAPHWRRLWITLNRLGNGWLYLPLAVLAPLLAGRRSIPFLRVAALSLIVAFLLYSFLKPRLARLRPCDLDPGMSTAVLALDKYSCPSGHCMTAAAIGYPLAHEFPSLLLLVIAGWGLIAWSRLSLGHHYPTDLLAGGLIGAGVSWLISAL